MCAYAGPKITRRNAYGYSTCQQQGNCDTMCSTVMQNLDHDPVDMDEENAEVTNSLEVWHTMPHGIFTCMK